jgi:pheromone shutdown protein TraB
MVHIGQEQFYVNVRNEILEFKHKGYVLFYEWIDYNQTDEITLRKTKKLVGLVPSQKGYSQILSNIKLEGVTVQDNQLFLGLVNGRDFNVDITPEEVISAYEKQFGEIQLSREELESPLDELYEPSQGSENLKSIILDYRNRYLASKIQESQYDKIVVIYGADHQIGLLEELQSLDQSWRRADP